MRILNLLRERNVSTVITVTHDTHCALSLCDRAVCLASDVIADDGNKCLDNQYFTYENKHLIGIDLSAAMRSFHHWKMSDGI